MLKGISGMELKKTRGIAGSAPLPSTITTYVMRARAALKLALEDLD
jgi:hypothetical protein